MRQFSAASGRHLGLQRLPKAPAAKDFYDNTLDMQRDMNRQFKRPDSAVVLVPGLGEGAFSAQMGDPPAAGAIVLVGFLRGRVHGTVQAWKEGANADEIARAAARQVVAKLP